MRDWARTAVLCLAFLMWGDSAAQGQVPMAIDLSAAGQEATAQKIPIVLFFSIEECEYCDAVRTEFLDHLSTDSGYTGRLLLREIRLDSAMTMVGFDGLQTTHTAFADRRGIGLVPTVQFTDGSGTTLEDDIEGLGTIEFYGAYLEHGIEKALGTLRQRN